MAADLSKSIQHLTEEVFGIEDHGINPSLNVGTGDVTIGDDLTTVDLIVTGATTLNGNVAVGNASTDLVGFHGATAVDQASAYTQTYATADKTHANSTYSAPSVTSAAHTYPGSGNMFDAVAADLLINVRTDSTANAVADIVVNEKSLADNLNQNIADLADTAAFVNSIADKLQDLGILS